MSGFFPHSPSRASEAEVIARLNMIAARLDGWTAEIKSDLATKYNPRQPRAPRGTPIGGQWVDSGGGNTSGGRFGVRKPARDPWLHDAMTNKPPHDRDPSDILEGGGYSGPARGGVGASQGRGSLNQSHLDKRANEQASAFLKKPPKEKLTDHGGVRTSERLPSVQEIDEAVKSAITRGQYTVKKRKVWI